MPQTRDKRRRDPTCAFCKGMHKTTSCTSVTCPKERLAIVKSAGLCFNCLARHKVSECTSKFSCRECHKKHHTTLCHAFTTNIRPTQHDEVQPEAVLPPTNSATTAPTNSTLMSTNTTLAASTSSLTTMTPPPLSALHTSVCLLNLKLPLRTYQETQLPLKATFSLMKGPNAHSSLKS